MSDIASRLEALADLGIHRVGDAVLEKTHLDGTRKWESATIEDALDAVEADLEKHPGIFGHTISRSDATHETVDLLRAQAATTVPVAEGENASPIDTPEPEVDPTGVTSEVPGDTATGRVGSESDAPEPEAPAVPEGAIQS